MEKEEFKRIISYQIYKRRMDRNWTQAELAELVNVSKSTIQVHESRANIPTALALCNIAEAFGCSMDELCGR